MISVKEAKQIIQDNAETLMPVTLPLQQAAGHVLAADLCSLTDIPAFDQSSMDGYAFLFQQPGTGKRSILTGDIPAGAGTLPELLPHQAVRIFTGGPVPPGADTVVMQEKVTVREKELIIQDEQLKAGTNVRPKGSEIKAGVLALEANSYLSPAAIGFLAGMCFI